MEARARTAPIVIVEDDDDLREAIVDTLKVNKFDFSVFENAEDAIEQVDLRNIEILVTDYKLPGMNGISLVLEAKKRAPHLPVVMMTAYADTQLAVQALKAGARDFLVKPFSPEHLVEVIRRHSRGPEAELVDRDGAAEIIAADPATVAAFARCQRLASVDVPGLLTGESGVGKEVFARHIHASSPRRGQPFVAVNCSAIPDQLLESMMFGFEKGAFTGAIKSQPGKFEMANGGTLFLDEIGEMPLGLQAKLLRVLQDGTVERLGSNKPVKYDIRILAATNQNVPEQIRLGKFREDLYFRLAVFEIKIPPLRERSGDILPLAQLMLEKFGRTMSRQGRSLSVQAQSALLKYRWPGNVRELENAIQRALLLSDKTTIDSRDLEIETPTHDDLPREGVSSIDGTDIADNPAVDTEETFEMEVVERRHILRVLTHVSGNRKRAAELLGVSERGLRYKLQGYEEKGLLPPELK
ncbi:MAG: sigma-54-dependent Fis family transcriptional regulator [Gammaproteobacteria bacterium]|nr:sigma-54-dependent Fis family transcriptional regulator [Gammaproteobacteria bacterium]